MRSFATRLALAALLVAPAQGAAAQTADEIVDKHLSALGGRAALEKLTSRTATGTIVVSTPGGDISGSIEIFNQAPNKSRTLMTLDLSALGAGQMTVDQRFNGATGYVIDTMQGNRDITGGQLENMKNGAFPSPLLTYKERGIAVELSGKEKVGGRDAYVLLIKPKSGPASRQFIDAETYLPMKVVVQVEVPQLGGEVEQTTEFSDFRDVDGIKTPFQVKSTSSFQSFTITITKVEHNTKIDEALFSKPGH